MSLCCQKVVSLRYLKITRDLLILDVTTTVQVCCCGLGSALLCCASKIAFHKCFWMRIGIFWIFFLFYVKEKDLVGWRGRQKYSLNRHLYYLFGVGKWQMRNLKHKIVKLFWFLVKHKDFRKRFNMGNQNFWI